jgi:hypothetical protein
VKKKVPVSVSADVSGASGSFPQNAFHLSSGLILFLSVVSRVLSNFHMKQGCPDVFALYHTL